MVPGLWLLKSQIKFNLEIVKGVEYRVPIFLIQVYALLLPFEYLTTVITGENFIWKPYRLIGILFIVSTMMINFKRGIFNYYSLQKDKVFYSIFFIGLVITIIRIFVTDVNLDFFVNDILQMFLYILIFVCFKQIPFTEKQVNFNLKNIFLWGVSPMLFMSLYCNLLLAKRA